MTPTNEKKDRDVDDELKKEQPNDAGSKSRNSSRGRRSKSKMPKADTSKQEDNDEDCGGQTSEAVEKKEVDGKDEQQTEANISHTITEAKMLDSDKSKPEENGK